MSEDLLKTAIIGTGFGSVVQYPAFTQHPDFDPILLIGQHQSKTKKIGARLGVKNTSTRWKDAIEDSSINVVSIATPPKLHKKIAIAALEAGKHVICEKPMALNSQDCREMLEVAEESGLVAMIDLEFRYMPTKMYLLELIKNGYLGEMFQFDVSIYTSSRINPRKQGYNWWSDSKTGGGVLGALGSHYIDYINLICGQINGVVGKTATNIKKRLNKFTGKMDTVTADDSFSCLFDVGNDVHCSLKISSTAPFGGGSRVQCYGSEGTLVLDESNKIFGGKVGEDNFLKELKLPKTYKQEATEDSHYLVAPFKALLKDFSSGVKRGRSPHPNFKDGLDVQIWIDAIKKSSEKKKWIYP